MRLSSTHSAEPLAQLLDEYVSYLHETNPTIAGLDGIHEYDDLLEDPSKESIEAQIRELGGWSRRLEGILSSTLTSREKRERKVLADNIDARLFQLEQIRPWQSNPLHYAETLATSLSSQVLFNYAPVSDRARRLVSKLRQVPRFLDAAQENISDPPGLFVRVGLESLEGVLLFVERDLPKVFRNLDDMHILGDLADASTLASNALRNYLVHLRDTVAPRSRASFRLGADRFSTKLRLEEGIETSAQHLLEIASAELQEKKDEFQSVASELAGGSAKAWETLKGRHPGADELLAVAEGQLNTLLTFIRRKRLMKVPEHPLPIVAPTPDFYRWTFASLWSAGPYESKSLPAYYYVTNVDPSWAAEKQEQHLRDLNHASLWSISMHEVFPGHFLHAEHLRLLENPLRKSNLFAPVSVTEGWAHYCEQMMLEEGFERGNTEIRLGQLSVSLLRLARTVVGIRLHTEDLSVEQGVRFFREEAFLEEGTARQEAERGTFNPSYVMYSIGKQMLNKLRADYKSMMGDKFSLGAFHNQFLSQGVLPFWLHRELMLGDTGTLIE
ncbi:DUF885 domain-containing protein [Myxococcota bacterium]|nr:DUF885 domain-containing protein [Myxococcota bacterium]